MKRKIDSNMLGCKENIKERVAFELNKALEFGGIKLQPTFL